MKLANITKHLLVTAIIGCMSVLTLPGSVFAVSQDGGNGEGCDACGGNTTGTIYIDADVCEILDLVVDQSNYGEGSVEIDSCELFGETTNGTIVADLIVTANIPYNITLSDVYLSKGGFPDFPLCPELTGQDDNSFAQADTITGAGTSREFTWENYAIGNGVTHKVKLFADANANCVPAGDPIFPAGMWSGTISVTLSAN